MKNSGNPGCLTLIVSENWSMELRQTSASRDSELSQDAANWYGIESYQAFGGVGQPDLVTHQVSKCLKSVSWGTHDARASRPILTGHGGCAMAANGKCALPSEDEGRFTRRSGRKLPRLQRSPSDAEAAYISI